MPLFLRWANKPWNYFVRVSIVVFGKDFAAQNILLQLDLWYDIQHKDIIGHWDVAGGQELDIAQYLLKIMRVQVGQCKKVPS